LPKPKLAPPFSTSASVGDCGTLIFPETGAEWFALTLGNGAGNGGKLFERMLRSFSFYKKNMAIYKMCSKITTL
jgi:hypothetical protein